MAGQVLEGVSLCFSYSVHASMPFMSDLMTGDSHKCLLRFCTWKATCPLPLLLLEKLYVD